MQHALSERAWSFWCCVVQTCKIEQSLQCALWRSAGHQRLHRDFWSKLMTNSVVRHDWNFKWHWLLWSDETEKRAFWQQTHQMSLVQTGIKKYPMSTVKYTAGSLMLWACFSAGGPGHLLQMHGIMDSIKYQQIKNQNLTASVRNLIMGRVWIFQQDNNPK